MEVQVRLVHLFPYSGFHFSEKGPRPCKDSSAADRVARLKESFELEGIRNTVEGVLVVQKENRPHLLLMRSKEAENTYYKLPGGRIMYGEDVIEGLRRKLTNKLALPGEETDWEIGDCIAIWWRPDYEGEFSPYLHSLIPEPKEHKMVFIVHLSEGMDIAVPENFKLVPMPFAGLDDSTEIFGEVISAIPAQLSRFLLQYHKD